MRNRIAAIAMAIASWSTLGCTAQARSPEPVPVDRIECTRCRMLISTADGASEIVSAREDTRFYDDVACLAADWHAHGADATAWVRLGDGSWREARAASYARPAAARTAMGSGLLAFATADAARAADRDGRVRTWNDIIDQKEARP